MNVEWTRGGDGVHAAECAIGPGRGGRLLAEVHRDAIVEGGCRWAWHVWSPTGSCGMHVGAAGTLGAAKAMAELALLAVLTSRHEETA